MHLEGVLEPELKFELAARNGLDLPYDEDQSRYLDALEEYAATSA